MGIILDAFKKQLLLCEEFVVEMLHRRAEIEKQHFSKKPPTRLTMCV
jgi:hypothetical protein